MSEAWAQSPEVVSLGPPGGTVTLVEGSTFCISGRSGDIRPAAAQGFFFQDARHLSQFEILIDGQALEPLSVSNDDPHAATFVSRARPRPGRADSTIVMFRRRYLGDGLREEIDIRNFGDEATTFEVEVLIDGDFAHVFEVKESRVVQRGEVTRFGEGSKVGVRFRDGHNTRGTVTDFSEAPSHVERGASQFECVIEPGGSWILRADIAPIVGENQIEPRTRDEAGDGAHPGERLRQWRRHVPVLTTDYSPLSQAVHQGQEDLGSLRIFGPQFPDGAVIAAGAPWFMTLFGRDSLITAWMALLVDPDLSLGVLDALARYQGTEVNPRTDEEPGRIMHEMRIAHAEGLGFESSNVYYGASDATPLFVMLLGELRRWGLAPGLVERLLPAADKALSWIENYGDRDKDGYVEYERSTDQGIRNQAWKDSFDAIRFSDGRLARTPIATAEIQGYVYAAYRARSYFAAESGDDALALAYREKAASLKRRFNEDFWMEDRGCFAMALDRDKQRVDAVASNMGHCLWTGIVDDEKAPLVARRLVAQDMFSGWGLRTLATTMAGYNPIGYHTGAVWPHDSIITAAGLMRYGFVEESQSIILGVLEAAASNNGRLPELFSGLDRSELSTTVSFPTSCSPQAWSAASPLLGLRTLLRFEPSVPQKTLFLSPVLPRRIRHMKLERVPLDGRRITVEVDRDHVRVEGLGEEIVVVDDPLMGRGGGSGEAF